ncbi:MAG: hypothetical protein F6J95_006400 [Leptolyngbya sp. SIO1E4]|nr:hypothetical protein [Leptolyngbya sp. SIO1E4]
MTIFGAVMLFMGIAPGAQGHEAFLQELPDGEHYYRGHGASELLTAPYTLFRKWGRIVVGIHGHSAMDAACFKGFLDGSTLVDATRVLPPYTPDAEWDYQPGVMLDLGQYEKVTDPMVAADREALEVCLEVFSR